MKYLSFLIMMISFSFLVHAQDWPNLAKYRNDNARIGLPAPGENRVVFMGNSITEGWRQHDSVFFDSHSYIDRGISGQTSPQMVLRFKQDVIDLKPKVVLILAGTNDIAGNTGPSTLEMIEDNLSSMTALAKANNIVVVLCSVLPAYDYPWKPGLQPAEKIVTLNKWIKDYAEANDCFYLDYYSSMVDERKGLKAVYSTDGVHPNLEGYKVMEDLAQKMIDSVLQKNNSMNTSMAPQMDHTTIYVVDLKKSVAFYKNVMLLPEIDEPFKDGKHVWLKLAPHVQLHVVSGAKKIIPHDINIHLAFHVSSLPDFIKHLDEYKIKYGNWQGGKKIQMRPDGVGQIYFQDPDGYWIEVNDDKF